jgi:hypothetical protein
MLQALMLTYEEPTVSELAILASFQADDKGNDELRDLVGRCKSFLSLKGESDSPAAKVCFKSPIVKPHLLRRAKALMGVSEEEIKWMHGEMALRSFLHLMERFHLPEPETNPEEIVYDAPEEGTVLEEDEGEEEAANGEEVSGEGEQEQKEEEEEEEEDEDQEEDEEEEEDDDDDDDSDASSESDDEIKKPDITALPYMVKNWLHHAANSTVEMAENLSLEESFWSPESPIRHRWLAHFNYLTKAYGKFPWHTMKGLHIAASVGFRQLVTALIKNGHETELHDRDEWKNTPVRIPFAIAHLTKEY